MVKLRDIGFVAHGHEQKVAPFFRFSHAVDFHSRTGFRQLIVIPVNVLRISEKVRCTNDVAKNLVGGGHGRGSREMIDEVGEKELLRRELAYFLSILLIIRRNALRTRTRGREAGEKKTRQRQKPNPPQ